MAKLKGWFADLHQENLKDDAYKRSYQAERLVTAATELILELLEKAGMSKSKAADHLGVSRANISQVLSGNRNLTLNTLSDICFVAGYKIDITATEMVRGRSRFTYDSEFTPDTVGTSLQQGELIPFPNRYATMSWDGVKSGHG